MKRLIRQNDDTSMDAVARFVEEHFAENISPESLAKQFHMTSSRLSRSFYDAFQVSPINYAIDLRMERAAALLTEGGLAPEEIALRTGFEDYVHFHTLFRNRVGMTPEQYLKEFAGHVPEPAPEAGEPAGEPLPEQPEEGPAFSPEAAEAFPSGVQRDPEDTESPQAQQDQEEAESPEALQAWAAETF